MRLVIQRVRKARVTDIDKDKVVGEIGAGLLVLLGVGKQDDLTRTSAMAQKLVNLRIMPDPSDSLPRSEARGSRQVGKMNLSVKEAGGEILVVSQFTLFADTSGGRRPSFIKAAEPELAQQIYERFIEELKELGVKVETGSFGHYMEIESVADGPVTIILEN